MYVLGTVVMCLDSPICLRLTLLMATTVAERTATSAGETNCFVTFVETSMEKDEQKKKEKRRKGKGTREKRRGRREKGSG